MNTKDEIEGREMKIIQFQNPKSEKKIKKWEVSIIEEGMVL